MKKTIVPLILLGAITLLPIAGIFHPGFFATDDGSWMVIRLSAFYESLRNGQFPVRYLPRLNNGLGYPVADFLYPLFLYLGSIIHALRIPYVLTVKILFGISFALSAAGSFLWLRKKFSKTAAIVGSAVFTLFPYHLWDMTKRGSLGEVLALGILPFIFWSLESNNILLTGLGIGLLILAHNSLALLFFPVIIGYIVIEKKYKTGFAALVLGLGLSAFFWIPALYDKRFTVFDTTAVSDFSKYFLTESTYNLLGVISIFIIILSIFVLIKKQKKTAAYFFGVSLVSIFFALSFSNPLWNLFHLGTYIQFPFRFLSITAFSLSFLASFTVSLLSGKARYILSIFLIAALYLFSWQFFFAKTYQYYPDSFYNTNQATTTVQNEYMPVKVKIEKLIHSANSGQAVKSSNAEVINGIAKIKNLVTRGTNINLLLDSKTLSVLQINFVYFPGWSAKVDGKDVKLGIGQTGLINLSVEKGVHKISVWFGETPIRMFSDLLSIICFAAFVFLIIRNKRLI